jgi:hypothetical protein
MRETLKSRNIKGGFHCILFSCFQSLFDHSGTRGSIVALCLKLEGRRFDTQWGEFLNLPNPSGRTRPWGLPVSNRNEYDKHKNNTVSGE